jgi:sugar phosphate isomerase/epimerase
MKPKIALQLYSVREIINPGNFEETIHQIAKMGYQGVETVAPKDISTKTAGKIFKESGLEVTSIHVFPPPMGKLFKEAYSILRDYHCRQIVSGYGADKFVNLSEIKRICEEINACNELCRAYGVTLHIHNHAHEYIPVEGVFPYQVMLENIDPEVFFEVDTYWVTVAGVDPVKVLHEMGSRAHLVHMKDGPGVKGQPNVAVGQGVVDVPAILKTVQGSADWLIVEFDRSATDILKAVEDSCQYLASHV